MVSAKSRCAFHRDQQQCSVGPPAPYLFYSWYTHRKASQPISHATPAKLYVDELVLHLLDAVMGQIRQCNYRSTIT